MNAAALGARLQDRLVDMQPGPSQILADVLGVKLHRLDHVETATSIAAAIPISSSAPPSSPSATM